jgi:DNA polymerase I-like protein with 3'-5' exonuclease and polymerase domains
MEGLFGEDFNINLSQTKADVKKLVKKATSAKKSTKTDEEKLLSSKKLTIEERLAIITEKVIKTLGSQRTNTRVIRSLDDFSAYVDKAIEAGRIDIDTETNNTTDAMSSDMVGLCLYVPGEKQVYIPIKHVNYETGELLPNQLTYADCKTQLQRVLDNKVKVIMHNGKFDYEVINHTCKIAVKPDWDTIIAARLIDENLYSDKKTSLKWLYVNLIDPKQAKYDIEGLFENVPYAFVDPEIFALYAATDSMMTDKIYLWEQPFFEGVDNQKLKWLFENIEMPIVEVTAKMEMRGVCIDGEFGEKLKIKYNNELIRIDEKINAELEHLKDKIEAWRLTPAANEKTKTYVPKKTKMTQQKIEEMYNLIDSDGKRYKETKPKTEQLGDPINLASPVQLAILFYDVCGAPQVNSKNPRATGEDELKEIHEKMPDLDICTLILERRGIVKLITTYIDVIPDLAQHWADGRIRFRLNSMGTDTGRYSSGGKWKYLDKDNKAVEISGINIQNIPSHNPEIRMLFKAKVNEFVVNFQAGIGEILDEISEVETTNGYVFVKELTTNDKLITSDGLLLSIAQITYNPDKKASMIFTDADGQVNCKTRYKIIGSDYSAQEPRLTAFVSQDQTMIDAYMKGQDLYAVIAQSAFDNKYEDNLEFYPEGTEIEENGKKIICGYKTNMNKQGKERRKVGKVLQLAATYGMSGATAGSNMGKSADDGELLLAKFFKKFHGVADTIAWSKDFLKKTGYVEDWAGRRRHLPEIGLNIPLFKSNKYNSDECPNLIYNLKIKKIISENIFTIKYDMNLTKEEKGEFIIGEDLLKYD